jgi:RimJ/RimL family protein N-acetyltransferase
MSEALSAFIDLFWSMPSAFYFPAPKGQGRDCSYEVVNVKYDRLLASADSENLASRRVLEKAGSQKGEYKESYERGIFAGTKKRYLQYFYLERPK